MLRNIVNSVPFEQDIVAHFLTLHLIEVGQVWLKIRHIISDQLSVKVILSILGSFDPYVKSTVVFESFANLRRNQYGIG